MRVDELAAAIAACAGKVCVFVGEDENHWEDTRIVIRFSDGTELRIDADWVYQISVGKT